MSNLIVFLQSLPCMFMGLNVMGIVFKLVKNYKDKGVVWVKKMLTHHSSLKYHHLSLITENSPTSFGDMFGTCFQLLITQKL